MDHQLTLWPEETHALHGLSQEEVGHLVLPTSPDTSLPWPGDYAHNGWSARMFLHQMLRTSPLEWSCSDTTSLLSRSTLAISPVRVGDGTTCVDALTPGPPPISSGLYLTAANIAGLARRALKRKRPLQRVLLRTATGWRRKALFVSNQGTGYAFYLPKRLNPCKGSVEAGLLDFLNGAVAQWLVKQ